MFSCLQNFEGKNQRHILEVAFSSKASSIKFKWDSYFVSFHFLLFLLLFSLCFRFPLLPSKWCNFNCMRDKSRRLAQLNWANPLVMLHKYRFVVSCWCLMLCVCVVYVYVHMPVVRASRAVLCWCVESLNSRVWLFLHVHSRTVQTTTVPLVVRFEYSFHWHSFAVSSFICIDFPSEQILILSVFNHRISDLIKNVW